MRMGHISIEVKARCSNSRRIRRILRRHSADFRGIDRQKDTYFNVPRGRLKLREGNIENALIFYNRTDKSGPKQADVLLFRCDQNPQLKEILRAALGVLVVVAKKREIYFLENVKFHVDKVYGLGSFVEIEAIDETGKIGRKALLSQCRRYVRLFGIKQADLIDSSYSDMILAGD